MAPPVCLLAIFATLNATQAPQRQVASQEPTSLYLRDAPVMGFWSGDDGGVGGHWFPGFGLVLGLRRASVCFIWSGRECTPHLTIWGLRRFPLRRILDSQVWMGRLVARLIYAIQRAYWCGLCSRVCVVAILRCHSSLGLGLV